MSMIPLHWRPISEAPHWLKAHPSTQYLVAHVTFQHFDDREEGGRHVVHWMQRATLMASGWAVDTRGMAGVTGGHACLKLREPTHFCEIVHPWEVA